MKTRSATFEVDGWQQLSGIFRGEDLDRLRAAMRALSTEQDEAVRQRDGAVYAARNVLNLCPEVQELWRQSELVEFVREHLGMGAGLVRALYFDKPPDQTWALPWHKDLLIAVEPFESAPGFSRPRPRAGVLHSEPPLAVLEQMVTLRIHLDPMTLDNGPLQVLSGSHRTGKTLQLEEFAPVVIVSDAGDVLAMRPLVVHSSGRSSPGCTAHRRVLHLEFSSQGTLSEPVRWHQFIPVDRPGDLS